MGNERNSENNNFFVHLFKPTVKSFKYSEKKGIVTDSTSAEYCNVIELSALGAELQVMHHFLCIFVPTFAAGLSFFSH